MARIRTIKPEFFTSLTIASLPIEARLTFVGLWTHVDDEGRCVDDPRLVKAAVWPLDDRLSADIERDLQALTESSLILRYKVGERSYICVRGWGEHQRINRPTKSKLPPPAQRTDPPPSSHPAPPQPAQTPDQDVSLPEPVVPPETTHGWLTEDSVQERNREQGTGNRENTPALAPLDAVSIVPAGDEHPPVALFVVPETGTDLQPVAPNAGVLTKDWIDHCSANGVKLTNSSIKRYARHIKAAYDQGFTEPLIRQALGEMFRDRVVSRPALFENYVIRIQQGPELPPQRLSRHQADAERRAPEGMTSSQQLYDTLTRPA